MGGASASAVPAASSAGGYASKGAMSAATIGGTTGSNVSGMGWVPKAQAAGGGGGMNYTELAKLFGGALKDSSGQLGKAVSEQQGGVSSFEGYKFDPSAFFQASQPFSFSGPSQSLPRVRSAPFQIANATGSPLRQTGLGYTI